MTARAFAYFATLAMVLTVFAVLPRGVSAASGGTTGTPSAVGNGTLSGPGLEVTSTPDGETNASDLATFTRWDGAVRPYSDMNASSADWPYLVNDTGSAFVVHAAGATFTQGKVANAVYEIRPTEIKETIVLNSSFPSVVTSPAIDVPFSTDYLALGNSSGIVLLTSSGVVVWATAPFVAWDSASPEDTWDEPVASLTYANGDLVLALNTTMLDRATYPLYLDPTWTLSSTSGWGASTFVNAVEDNGDHNIKIGWLADDFNDNTNDIWTIESGAATFASGVMQLSTNTAVHAGSAWSDYRFGFQVRFTAGGTAAAYFRYQNSNNYYVLQMSQTTGALTLQKRFNGILYTVHSATQAISLNTDYAVKLRVAGSWFELWWQGRLLWSGFDNTGPGYPPNGYIRFSTDSLARMNVDNVRVWNTAWGTMATAVRDAGTGSYPVQTEIVGTVDAFNQTHVRITSSSDRLHWSPWKNLKADMASGTFYPVPDQDAVEFYQLQVNLSSGNEGTPNLSQLSTIETSGLRAISPTANTGFEAWYPYVAGTVNLVTGNVYESAEDLSFQGKAFTLAIARSYNSALGGQAGPFGLGWTLTYGQSLAFGTGGNVTWNGPDGSSFPFIAKGTTGGYAAPRGVPDRLVKNTGGTYTLWTPDGAQENFDSTGKLTSLVDRNGNRLTLTYTSGKLTNVADATGKTFTLSYDANGRVISIKDPMNRYSNYSYDGSGNLVQVRDPMGFLTNYTYASGRIASIVDPVGKRTAFAYDGSGRATGITLGFSQGGATIWSFQEYAIAYNSSTTRAVRNARGYWTSLTLNSFGNVLSLAGPSIGCSCDSYGNSSSYAWDGELNQIARADGRGDTWATTYGVRANLLSTTDPGGNVSSRQWLEVSNATTYLVLPASSMTYRGFTTSYAYDWKGNRISVTDSGGNVTQYAYDASGFLNQTVSPRGYTTWFVYNGSGWLVKRVDPMNDVTQYGYDAIGRQTSATDPLTFVTRRTYDVDSRVKTVTDPLLNVTSYAYNHRGNLISVTDPDNLTTTYVINVTGAKPQAMKDSGGNWTNYSYDFRDNLVGVTDANLHTTIYAYDAYDRPSNMSTPLKRVTSFAYDASGNRIRRTDANNATTTYGYDMLNRLNATRYPGPPVYPSPMTVYNQYDKDGNLISEVGLGYRETETYDKNGRLSMMTFVFSAFSVTLTYAYDADGNKATMALGTATTRYSYDKADRLTGILDPEGQNTTFGYDSNSRQTSKHDPSGVITTWIYDKESRLMAIYTNTSGGAVLESFTYTHDKAGLRTSETDVQGGTSTTTSYFYDRNERLNKTTQGASVTVDTYDGVGNLKKETNGSSIESYSNDADNELTNASFGPASYVTYGYDNNGNRKTRTVYGGATTTYVYDYENRLISTRGGCNYTYAPTGERVTSTCLTGTTDLMYDPSTHGESNLLGMYAPSGAQTARYLDTSAMNTPVEIYEGGAHYSYETDALGSVRMLTGGSQNATDTYGYDSWGKTISGSGVMANPLQYTSSFRDAPDGLYYNRARFYDPSADGGHRFLSPDTGGCPRAGPRRYTYVGDSPVNHADPTGHDVPDVASWSDCLGAFGNPTLTYYGCVYCCWVVDRFCEIACDTAAATPGASNNPVGCTSPCWMFYEDCVYSCGLSFWRARGSGRGVPI